LYAGRDMLNRPVAETQPEAVAQGFLSLLDRVYYGGETYLAADVAGWVNGPDGGPPQERYFNFAYQPIREAGQIVGVSVFAFEVTEQVLGRQQVAQSQAQLAQLSQHLEQANEYLATSNETLALTNVELLAASNEAQLANQELATTNQQLRQTNVDLDNFIYTASHDLRTPITNIEGLLRALRTELPQASQVADVPYMLELMQESVNRFKRTLEHLTDISRLQKEYGLPIKPVHVADIIRDVRLDLAPLVEKVDVRLDVEVPTWATLLFLPKNLRSVVYNLLSNAIKYRAPGRVPHVRVRCYYTEHHLVLEVQDNGLGLDLANVPNLFGLFQRFHTHVEGSGIGLYMVKRMVENAGGRIEVHSELGVGSTFAIHFQPDMSPGGHLLE
jgi:signal transduction histidine kinase